MSAIAFASTDAEAIKLYLTLCAIDLELPLAEFLRVAVRHPIGNRLDDGANLVDAIAPLPTPTSVPWRQNRQPAV